MHRKVVTVRHDLPALPPLTQLSGVTDAELVELAEQFATPIPAPNGSYRGGSTTIRQPNGSPRPAEGGQGRGPAGGGQQKRPNRSGGGGYTKDEAAADLVTRLALGERFGSQDELRERYGVAKSTMSEWIREWERSGLVPARTQQGRCKALATA